MAVVSGFGLRPSNIDGQPVVGMDRLLLLLIFNIAYDTSVFPGETHRVQLARCYLFLAYTGARPAEIVDINNEKSKPKDGSWEELYGPEAIRDEGEDNDKTFDNMICNDRKAQECGHATVEVGGLLPLDVDQSSFKQPGRDPELGAGREA